MENKRNNSKNSSTHSCVILWGSCAPVWNGSCHTNKIDIHLNGNFARTSKVHIAWPGSTSLLMLHLQNLRRRQSTVRQWEGINNPLLSMEIPIHKTPSNCHKRDWNRGNLFGKIQTFGLPDPLIWTQSEMPNGHIFMHTTNQPSLIRLSLLPARNYPEKYGAGLTGSELVTMGVICYHMSGVSLAIPSVNLEHLTKQKIPENLGGRLQKISGCDIDLWFFLCTSFINSNVTVM